MRIFYTVIFALTFSSNIFAYNFDGKLPINAYIMEQTEQAKEVSDSVSHMRQFHIVCIDGYRFLFTRNGTVQMKNNAQGTKYIYSECPIEKP